MAKVSTSQLSTRINIISIQTCQLFFILLSLLSTKVVFCEFLSSIMENQFFCEICQIPCGNGFNWSAHLAGKAHKSKMGNAVPLQDLFCKECDLQLQSKHNHDQHLLSNAYKQRCRYLGVASAPAKVPVQQVFLDIDGEDLFNDFISHTSK